MNRDTMTRTGVAPWRAARTLTDLAELTAQWIEGTIPWQPAYCGTTDIDTPRMAEVLAQVNRAGFMTVQSQEAADGPGFDGAHWRQRAAVYGYATEEITDRICQQAPAGFHVIAYDPADLARWRNYWGNAVTITWRDGEDYTEFGGHVCRRSICDPHTGWGLLDRAAQLAVCRAWQLTVIDLQAGRQDLLWDFLADISKQGER